MAATEHGVGGGGQGSPAGEQARLAEALRRAEERLAVAMRVGRLGFWEWDLASGTVSFRTGYSSVLDPNYGEFEGPFEKFMSFIHADDRPVLLAAFEEARTSRGLASCEVRVRFPDGHVEWRQATGRFRYDDAGQPLRAHAIIRDIDAERRATGELAASREQLRAFATRLERVREEERTRIAREIHDELGQALTAVKMELAWLERHVSDAATGGEAALRERLAATVVIVDSTMRAVRRIATELRPSVLDDLGLVPAVEWLAQDLRERSGLGVEVRVPPAGIEADGEQATALFRVLQEILTNVVRHAAARSVAVTLAEERGHVVLEVRDDGCGIAPERVRAAGALGILGMRERVAGAGGSLTIQGQPGIGTTITVRVPLRRA